VAADGYQQARQQYIATLKHYCVPCYATQHFRCLILLLLLLLLLLLVLPAAAVVAAAQTLLSLPAVAAWLAAVDAGALNTSK
jgi:hypothetical protein